MVGCQVFVRDVRIFVGTRVHTHGGAIHDDFVFVHHFLGQVFVGEHAFLGGTGNELGFQSQFLQSVIDGFRRASCTQYQGFLVLGFQQRFDGIGEADDVRVVADKFQLSLLLAYLDDIDGTNRLGVIVQLIQERNDLFLIRNGYVQAYQVGVTQQDIGQFINCRNFKVDIFGINVFGLELLVEEVLGKRMSERIAYQTEFIHRGNFF